MRHTVVAVFENGRLLQRQEIARMIPVVGDLRIQWKHDATRNRAIRVARLFIPGDHEETLLPNLEGVEIVGMSAAAFTLSGLEHASGIYFAQAWLVRQAPPVRTPDPSTMHPADRRRRGL